MIHPYRFYPWLFLFVALFAPAALAQSATEVFEDPDGKYTLNLPAGWLGIVNTDGLGRKDVNIVYKVRENGALKVRVAEVAAEPMDYAAKDEQERIRFSPGYDKLSLERFLLGGGKSGALLSYDYKNASGQLFTGRVYYLRMDEKTIYVLHFTGRRNILSTLRSHTDAIARSFKLKQANPQQAEKK